MTLIRKMANAKFVLVSIKTAHNKSAHPASFTQSVLDVLCGGKDAGSIYAQVKEDRVIASDEPQYPSHKPVKIKRPSFCPIHHISEEQIQALPEDIRTRGINTGAATVLESCDGKVLLTRRAAHLRTFPGVWVPPGGHIECGETFDEAALREMKEEVGLSFTSDDIQSTSQLAFWESVFPTKLSIGLPRRHHLVCYVHVKLRPPHTAASLNQRIHMDPNEVGACAWMDKQQVRAIVAANEEPSDNDSSNQISDKVHGETLPDTFSAMVTTREGAVSEQQIASSVLTSVCEGREADTERVSTGTKFALSVWLEHS